MPREMGARAPGRAGCQLAYTLSDVVVQPQVVVLDKVGPGSGGAAARATAARARCRRCARCDAPTARSYGLQPLP